MVPMVSFDGTNAAAPDVAAVSLMTATNHNGNLMYRFPDD